MSEHNAPSPISPDAQTAPSPPAGALRRFREGIPLPEPGEAFAGFLRWAYGPRAEEVLLDLQAEAASEPPIVPYRPRGGDRQRSRSRRVALQINPPLMRRLGLLGLATAWWLAEHGDRQAALYLTDRCADLGQLSGSARFDHLGVDEVRARLVEIYVRRGLDEATAHAFLEGVEPGVLEPGVLELGDEHVDVP